MKSILVIIFACLFYFCSSNDDLKANKYLVVSKKINNQYNYFLLNFKNDTILKLNPNKYWVCFNDNDTVENFLIVAPKDRKGWWGIDFKENYLFEVYNTSYGEPSPDELQYNRLRITDSTEKIGFADEKGKITIPISFEYASEFYKDYAIIGKSCKKTPWKTSNGKNSDEHFDFICNQYGYINKKGEIFEMGNFSLIELQKKLSFPTN